MTPQDAPGTHDPKKDPAPAAAHAKWWQTSEAIFGTALVLALILELTYPLSLTQWLARPVLLTLGGLAVCAGLILIILTRRQMSAAAQPTAPGIPTTKLVTTGVFAWSRNPIYLGLAALFISMALTVNSVWLLGTLALALIATHYVMIRPEEAYLTKLFGDDYRLYTQTVGRWWGHKNHRR